MRRGEEALSGDKTATKSGMALRRVVKSQREPIREEAKDREEAEDRECERHTSQVPANYRWNIKQVIRQVVT